MSRLPDYRLKLLNKKTSAKNENAGAGWVNEDGSITLVLNPCVVLESNSDLLYTLFLAKDNPTKIFKSQKRKSGTLPDDLPY